MLMAEKVPNLPSQDDELNWGVDDKSCADREGETSVVLDDTLSSTSRPRYVDSFLVGDAIEKDLGVTR